LSASIEVYIKSLAIKALYLFLKVARVNFFSNSESKYQQIKSKAIKKIRTFKTGFRSYFNPYEIVGTSILISSKHVELDIIKSFILILRLLAIGQNKDSKAHRKNKTYTSK